MLNQPLRPESAAAIAVRGVSHWYGERRALDDVSFSVETGAIFGLLGPNGGGKTTLFRILSTLLPLKRGQACVLGFDLSLQPDEIRRRIGVTFQSPSIDPKLTVVENLKHQGHLYGLAGRLLRERIDLLTDKLGLRERLNDRAESLSGGLKRRVEIAKGLLHHPAALLLDEPSTGLDPGARHDLWRYLRSLKDEEGVTVLVTTHLMEEAERCDMLAILDHGRLVALDTPHALRSTLGGDYVTVQCERPDLLGERIRERFGVTAQPIGGALRISKSRGHEFVRDLVEAFPEEVKTISLGKPTLEDVFIERTGHRFWDEEPV